jgi:hypothetical protein
MNKEIKSIEITESKMKESNLDRLGDHSDSCLICGKRTKEQFFVHYGTNGEIWNTLQTEETEVSFMIKGTETESQGLFPIGPDCAKHLPSEFVFKKEDLN